MPTITGTVPGVTRRDWRRLPWPPPERIAHGAAGTIVPFVVMVGIAALALGVDRLVDLPPPPAQMRDALGRLAALVFLSALTVGFARGYGTRRNWIGIEFVGWRLHVHAAMGWGMGATLLLLWLAAWLELWVLLPLRLLRSAV